MFSTRKLPFAGLCACLMMLTVAACLRAQPSAGMETAPWQPLGNQSIDDWIVRGGTANYELRDGEIVGSTVQGSPNTFLCTPRDYSDFILEYEFKTDPALNSGVQIRSHSLPEYNNGRVHGYQVEIDPRDDRKWSAGIYDEARLGWLNPLTDNEPAREAFRQGEWNHVRVEAIGPVMRTWINGVPAAALHDTQTASGFIGLQVHSNSSPTPLEVRWRNIRIQDLSSVADAQATPLSLPIKLNVFANGLERQDSTVAFSTAGIERANTGYALYELGDNDARTPVPVHYESGPVSGVGTLRFVVSGRTDDGGKRTYLLEDAAVSTSAAVLAQQNDKTVDVEFPGGDAPRSALSYHHAVMPSPNDNPIYDRSGFIHPILSPAGDPLTSVHAPDHIHHMGLWDVWTSTTYQGRHVDFWNPHKHTGTARFASMEHAESNSVWGGFTAIQEQVAKNTDEGVKAVVRDELDVKVWNAGDPDHYWVMDYRSTQNVIGDDPLTLEAYRYGGFAYRGPVEWGRGNSNYLTSQGLDRTNSHTTRARWVDCYGETANGTAGILFLSNPDNFNHPEPLRTWDNGWIFLVFTSIQDRPWVFEPGEHYTRNYRLIVHQGEMTPEAAERHWNDYANPMHVSAYQPAPGDTRTAAHVNND